MDQTMYGRALMGDSLGFHIIFALLGVGIPLLICLVELIGLWRKDDQFYLMARRWSFTMTALFVVGAISGLIISNQMSALWPPFMTLAGQVIGPAFYLEAFAFFIEAIFLGIYLYSWDRFASRWVHWLCSLPIVLGSVASAFFITTANAWMNSPQGFVYTNGVVSNVHPLAAIFNSATFTETTHSIVAYYLTTALCFAGTYAFFLFREKRKQKKIGESLRETPKTLYYKKAIVLLVWVSLFFTILMGLTGDDAARYIAHNEPIKFAAAENVLTTTAAAPLKLFDQPVGPAGSLSFLAFGNFHAIVEGLNAFDPSQWPPLWVHTMFDLMVVLGVVMGGVVIIFLILYLWKRARAAAFSQTMLMILFVTGFLGFFAVEFGWILTEVGRQPYAIAGIMLTVNAFTTSQRVLEFAYIFPSLYVVLFIITPWVLIRHYKKDPLDATKKYLKNV